eukprot:5031935-Amphidinium_carterae.1
METVGNSRSLDDLHGMNLLNMRSDKGEFFAPKAQNHPTNWTGRTKILKESGKDSEDSDCVMEDAYQRDAPQTHTPCVNL